VGKIMERRNLIMANIEASQTAVAANALFSRGFIDLNLPRRRGVSPSEPRGAVRVIGDTITLNGGIELFSVSVHRRTGRKAENTSLKGVTGRSRTGILGSLIEGSPNLRNAMFKLTQSRGNNGSR
jgi:hypothetical protein